MDVGEKNNYPKIKMETTTIKGFKRQQTKQLLFANHSMKRMIVG